MTATLPYSIRIPRDLLEDMKRHYDRMEPPKPTFSAILTHLLKIGWESYRTPVRVESRLTQAVMSPIAKSFGATRAQTRQ